MKLWAKILLPLALFAAHVAYAVPKTQNQIQTPNPPQSQMASQFQTGIFSGVQKGNQNKNKKSVQTSTKFKTQKSNEKRFLDSLHSNFEGRPQVVISGGGISGLVLLHRLTTMGVKAILVEKEDRVGGRIMTVYVNGIRIEKGAEKFSSNDYPLWELCDEFGIEYNLKPEDPEDANELLLFDEGLFTLKEMNQMIFDEDRAAKRESGNQFSALEMYVQDLQALGPHGHHTNVGSVLPLTARAREIDKLSVGKYLNEITGGRQPLLVRFLKMGFLSELGKRIQKMTALTLFEEYKVSLTPDGEGANVIFLPHNDERLTIKGGSEAIITRLKQIYGPEGKGLIYSGYELKSVGETAQGDKVLTLNKTQDPHSPPVRIYTKIAAMAMPIQNLKALDWTNTAPKNIPGAVRLNLKNATNTKIPLLFSHDILGKFHIRGFVDGFAFEIWPADTGVEGNNGKGVSMLFAGTTSLKDGVVIAQVRKILDKLEARFPGVTAAWEVEASKNNIFRWEHSYSTTDKPGTRGAVNEMSVKGVHPLHPDPKKGFEIVGEMYAVRGGYASDAVDSANKVSSEIGSVILGQSPELKMASGLGEINTHQSVVPGNCDSMVAASGY